MIIIILVLNLLLRLSAHGSLLLIILLIVLLLFLVLFECLKINDSLGSCRHLWLFLNLWLSTALLELVDYSGNSIDHLVDYVLLHSSLGHLSQVQGCLLGGQSRLRLWTRWLSVPPLLLYRWHCLPTVNSIGWEIVGESHPQERDSEDNDAQDDLDGAVAMQNQKLAEADED